MLKKSMLSAMVMMTFAWLAQTAPAASDLKGWDDLPLALKYYHNSDLQLQWAWEAFAKLGPLKGSEHVLDFGAGDGKISSLVSAMVPKGRVTGVDISPGMHGIAKSLYPASRRPNLEFILLTDPSFNDSDITAAYDLVVSFCVFHLVKEPTIVLQNIAKQMKPTGRLVMTWPSAQNPAFFQAIKETIAKHGIVLPQPSPQQMQIRDIDKAQAMFREAGFEVELAELVSTHNLFLNKHELIEYFVGTLSGNWKIAEDLRESFARDLVDRYLAISGQELGEDHPVFFDAVRIDIVAHKRS